jgi:membrane protein implicated in regulation of membrane protease activity
MVENNLPSNLFIFNEKNRGFLNGTSRQLSGKRTLDHVIKFTLLFYIGTAFPIGFILALIFAVIFQVSFLNLLLYQSIFMLLISLYVGYAGYRLRRKLEIEGQILVGEVASYDKRATFSRLGYKKSSRLKYWFLSPTGKIVYGYTLMPPQNTTHLPDGRELPQPNTPIAVLYVDDKRHTLL